jgi:diketogulonate reductase-like aldo/keto reductase
MPMIGLGTFAGAGGGISIGEAIDISLRIGYRHFDTAAQYGNEEEVSR